MRTCAVDNALKETVERHTSERVDRICCSDSKEAAPWDDFLIGCSHGHVEQSVAWGRLKQIYGWKPVWVWVRRGGKILGGAMILTRTVGGVATIGYVERGPVWEHDDKDALGLVTKALAETASELKIDYLVTALPYFTEVPLQWLDSLRFRRKPDTLPPTGVGLATLLIDLRRGTDELLADMSMTKRQNLRRAVRKGVQVRVGDHTDADKVRGLMWSACQRRGISPSPSQPDYFDNMWRLMGPAGQVQFFLAEVDGVAVSAAVTHTFNGKMQLWRVGWSGTHDECNPNDLLHWEVMKWGKENGCHVFDFMHIRPDHARALLRGERPRDSYSGVTDFKTSFGGQLRLLPDLYYRSFNPAAHLLLRMGAAKLIESGLGHDLLRSLSDTLG
jgi:peptidoglycan pentaglycine glycine transferase (the first glycine)